MVVNVPLNFLFPVLVATYLLSHFDDLNHEPKSFSCQLFYYVGDGGDDAYKIKIIGQLFP